MSDEKTERKPLKFRLRPGLRATNVEVHEADGSRHTERLEPGKVYEGEKYVRWCPSVLMALPETLKVGLPDAPELPVRRGRRRLRLGIAVSGGATSGAMATPMTTLTKKDPEGAVEGKSKTDEEAERGRPPAEPEGKPPEQEEAEKTPEEPVSEPQESQETVEDECDYEEPEITSKTDLRRMKKDELLTLALHHEYEVSEEHTKDDLLDVLYEHYNLD